MFLLSAFPSCFFFLHFLPASSFFISFLLLLPAIEQHASWMAAYACKVTSPTCVLLPWPHQDMMLWSLSSLILFPWPWHNVTWSCSSVLQFVSSPWSHQGLLMCPLSSFILFLWSSHPYLFMHLHPSCPSSFMVAPRPTVISSVFIMSLLCLWHITTCVLSEFLHIISLPWSHHGLLVYPLSSFMLLRWSWRFIALSHLLSHFISLFI